MECSPLVLVCAKRDRALIPNRFHRTIGRTGFIPAKDPIAELGCRLHEVVVGLAGLRTQSQTEDPTPGP